MSTLTVPAPAFGIRPRRRRWTGLEPLVLGGAVLAGGLAAYRPLLAVAACGALLLAGLVWRRPAVAGYLLVGITPLVAGIDRGVAIPFFRPNEALELLLGATLALRWLCGLRRGAVRFRGPGRLEVAIVAMAVANSVVLLLAMSVRGQEITADDLLYSLVLWKLLALYLIVRAAVRTVPEVRICLLVSVAAACVVAVIGILQGLGVLGVRTFLTHYYSQFGAVTQLTSVRGSSTLGLPAATADLMILNLALLTALWLRERRRTALFCAGVAVLVLGCLAAGEFSSMLGLVVGMGALALVTGSAAVLGFLGVLLVAGAVVVWPVISVRLAGFGHASGLPPSWLGRLHNLTTYFWPELTSHWNVLLGVRPAARVPVPTQLTGYVWIESGYLWLLWGGGLPLLGAFLFFVRVGASRGWRLARTRSDAMGAAGVAVFVGLVVMAVLMVFDPHLTYRGSADALFALLALTACADRGRPSAIPGRSPAAVVAPAAGGRLRAEETRS
ncbi:hypothetical protein [Petropleomorpha daqingensis]|uniref:O-antigen ligase like membrane protein n=1 Tax=Petropleomorpha daqingensis TaxID=2026353 RepID=A0A853CDJ0_9ACTN|nr:hypothetical protein [Petropleomorpha daqingensis]NYJ05844.1 hypothetical protein [Petropleomorpha daqingensis]